MKQKQDNVPCIVLFAIVFVGLLITIATHIGQSFLDFLKAAGLCLGAAVILLVLFMVISLFSNRLVRKSRHISLRCYPIELESPAALPIPADLPEKPGQETIQPLYLRASLTNYGLRLSPHPPRPAWQWFPVDNVARFNPLSGGHPASLVIPHYALHLYYRPVKQQGSLSFITGPADAPGFSGALPDSWGNQPLEVVIIYTAFCDPKKLNLTIPRSNPLKLRLVALDETGQEDPATTVTFYNLLWNAVKPAEPSDDDDDSWMYRSRPTMPW